MSIVLYRVDERLIHGQVVVAWGHALRFDTLIIVDDELAASEWERDLYRLAAGEARADFLTVDEALDTLPAAASSEERVVVLTRGLAAMRALGEAGLLDGVDVNLGGQHHAPDRREVLSYLHLTDGDLRDIERLTACGARVAARDVPDATRVPAEQLLGP